MKTVLLRHITCWFDENGELVTPDTFAKLTWEEREKLKPYYVELIYPFTFAYCEEHRKWELFRIYDPTRIRLTKYAKNCKELYSLVSIYHHFYTYINDYLNGNKVDRTAFVNSVRNWVSETLKSKFYTKERKYTYVLNILNDLLYFFDFEEFKELKKKVETKAITYNLKGVNK